jgi:MerR family transcriptional regulator, light-induced transcriptional regulator
MSTADQPHLPLRSVVLRTGLSEHRLRAWERRYGAVSPSRTQGGQRRYTEADLDRLRLLRDLVSGGRTIGSIASRSTGELRELVLADGSGAEFDPPTPSFEEEILAALRAVETRDSGAMYDLLARAAMLSPSLDFIEGLLAPLLRRIGRMWEEGVIGVGEEHIASQVVRDLGGRLLRASSARGPVLLCTTPAGQRHEFGALLAALAGAAAGWRILYAGPDLPPGEIARLATRAEAPVVALSILYPDAETELTRGLRALRAGLPSDVDIVLGGAAQAETAASEVDGIAFLRSYRELLELLDGRQHGALNVHAGPESLSPRGV